MWWCAIHDGLHEFHSSEQHYQFQHLHHHGKVDKSFTILETTSGWEAMKAAHEILPDTETQSDWWDKTVSVMTESNCLKYESCPHAQEVLLDSNVVLVEATSNVFWGSGLNPERTMAMLSDYWPGCNHMGKLLVCLREEFMDCDTLVEDSEEDSMSVRKCKASSLLDENSQKQSRSDD